MAQKINTQGPSYKQGYADGYDAAQHALSDAIAAQDDAYQRGYAAALAHARTKWTERMTELKAAGLLRELSTIDA